MAEPIAIETKVTILLAEYAPLRNGIAAKIKDSMDAYQLSG